jgi:hypothetical protein
VDASGRVASPLPDATGRVSMRLASAAEPLSGAFGAVSTALASGPEPSPDALGGVATPLLSASESASIPMRKLSRHMTAEVRRRAEAVGQTLGGGGRPCLRPRTPALKGAFGVATRCAARTLDRGDPGATCGQELRAGRGLPYANGAARMAGPAAGAPEDSRRSTAVVRAAGRRGTRQDSGGVVGQLDGGTSSYRRRARLLAA